MPNYLSDVIYSDQFGGSFFALVNKVMEMCEFIKQRWNIYQHKRAMLRLALVRPRMKEE